MQEVQPFLSEDAISVSRPRFPTTRAKHAKERKKLDELRERTWKDYSYGCCKQECMWDFTFKQCFGLHKFYCSKTTLEASSWLSTVMSSSLVENEFGTTSILHVHGKPVCQKAFKLLHGISNNKWNSVANNRDANRFPIHANTGNQNAVRTTTRVVLRTWLDEYIRSAGCANPAKDEIHLPVYLNKARLHEEFCSHWKDKQLSKESAPSLNTFRNFLSTEYAHVKFLKQTRLGRCTFCLSIPDLKKECSNDVDQASLAEAITQHSNLHRIQREFYAARIATAKEHPSRYLHLTFDSPESYHVPQKRPNNSKTAMKIPSEVRATGCINHTTGARYFNFTLPQYPKDANAIISAVYLNIVEYIRDHKEHPAVLWLQLDNCWRENKNRWMPAFMSWLIHMKFFNEVMVSFLLQGHTHIDIDQMFSTLAIYLDKNSCWSFGHLLDVIPNAYRSDTTRPVGRYIHKVFNWSGFFAPYLKEMSGHSSPHVFLFRRLPDGNVGMKTKAFHGTSDPWLGSTQNPDDWMIVMHSFPQGFPVEMQPQDLPEGYVNDQTIAAFKTFFTESQIGEWERMKATGKVDPSLLWTPPEHFDDPPKVIYVLFDGFT